MWGHDGTAAFSREVWLLIHLGIPGLFAVGTAIGLWVGYRLGLIEGEKRQKAIKASRSRVRKEVSDAARQTGIV